MVEATDYQQSDGTGDQQYMQQQQMMQQQEMYGEEVDYGDQIDPNQMGEQQPDSSNALVSSYKDLEVAMISLKM